MCPFSSNRYIGLPQPIQSSTPMLEFSPLLQGRQLLPLNQQEPPLPSVRTAIRAAHKICHCAIPVAAPSCACPAKSFFTHPTDAEASGVPLRKSIASATS